MQGGGPSDGTTYTFALLGDDPATLAAAARAVETEMRSVPGLANVINTAAIARPEIVVTPRPDEAALMGVTAQTISQAVRVATLGDVDQALAKYNLGDRQIPIRILLNPEARADLTVIENLRVPNGEGIPIPLSAVADVQFGSGPSQVLRQDRSRIASITAELNGIRSGEASVAVLDLPSVKNLPEGVRQIAAGDQQFIQEMISGFTVAFLTGIMLMYAVLVLLFKSFAYPVTKALFLGSLVLAVALDLSRLFFLVIIIPAILLMFIAYGLLSRWCFRATGSPWTGALVSALAFAWGIAVTFPAIQR
jgi:HAE1 family hydrophobic/amphiphilic exporter-1